ncbi:hypothetical protein BBBOND_0307280 [Babesia bigemina]|uniref:Uncharacterized protein n=1 Tax=Babesia bigemina TaxID=5866 RepID=A0A061DCQ7_BABBI|nr:hypothetical protein BBBOND_0307280 [Babesia bigemina]CDR96824.1 hypothetical protein BBBOND_0307280 [Babesia bigemina]|eukprot:XP_012769010.1 hypothetical protein BBBOND_0307280 [Babesia bigemina]
MELKRLCKLLITVCLTASVTMVRVAEGGVFSYFQGACDNVCQSCKFDCEKQYRAGTFNRWFCKGKCNAMMKK